MGLLARFGRQWVAGETVTDAIRAAKDANARGMDALVNRLGEHYLEKAPVEATVGEYTRLLTAMRSERIAGDPSLKPTQFGVLIDRAYALSRMLPLLELAKADHRILWLDMEGSATTDATTWICERLLEHYDRVGICIQANLKRSANDMERLIEVGARIRLVKGAYGEAPEIAYRTRPDIDRAYVRLLEVLFARSRDFVVASHDGRIVERAVALSKRHAMPFGFAMLQGVRDPLKAQLVRDGHRVAEYIPYGPDWLPYFARRLRERPRNIVTMVRSFVSG